MSYSSDIYSSSSYRKIFGDAPRSGRMGMGSSSSPSRMHSAGYRHRTYGSPSMMSSATYRRSAAPGRVFSSMPESMMDLTQSTAVTNELKIIRTNEKEQLQGLNDRFVSFIEKVHNLEQQNKVLEAEVTLLRQRNNEPSRLHELYEQEIRELRARVEELTHEKSQMHLDCVQMNDTLDRVKEKLEEETKLREEAENTLKDYRKDVDDATLARLELEKKVESLLDEIAFLRKVHEEELQELQASLQATQVSVEMDLSKPDLTAALKDIRVQYENLSARNQTQVEDWYRSKFASVNEAAARNQDAIKHSKEELSEYRRQVQARTLEIEALRGHNEALERQIAEMEDRHNNEIGEMQDTIQQLEAALRTTKGEMSRHLREYQDLLNVKMALDIEIAAYRKLLEGEECRLSSVGGAMVQSGYPGFSYMSARTYTLGAYRKSGAKPEEEEEEEGEEGEDEGEKGEEEEGGEEGEEGGEEEEEVEETVLCSKAPESKASPEKEKAEDKEASGGEEEEAAAEEEGGEQEEDAGSDEKEEKEEKEEVEKEKKEEKEEKKVKEEKSDEVVAKTDAQKTETKKEEPAKKDASKPSSPKSDSPKSDSPKSESPKSESPKPASPKSDSPKPGSPKSESPKPASPKSESPKEGSPKTGSPKPSSPKSESPKSESPKPGSPKAESPKKETAKPEPPKAAEEKSEKKSESTDDKKVEKKDVAMNGDIDKSSPEEKKDAGKESDVITNGVDESPVKEDGGQKVVITKTVETITTGEDGSKHVTKSITVTETVKEVEEVEVQEKLVSSKKTEKHSTQSIKQVTEGD